MAEGAARRRLLDRPGVLLVHWAFPPTTGGVESHLADAARLLSDKGIRVMVVTGEPAPLCASSYDVLSTPLLELDRIRDPRLRDRSYVDALESLLAGLLVEGGFRVVHGHNLHHFAPEPALVLDRLRDRLPFRLYHTFHETWPDVLHDRPVYRRWTGNYAVSRFVQGECWRRLGFRPRLARLGVDVQRFRVTREVFAGSGIPVILHPARLLPWKGVHVSVRMLAALAGRGIRATLIITDSQRIADWKQELAGYRREVVRLVYTLGLNRWVEFRPASFDDMPALYESADVVVYPTVEEEPYGLVPLEAMSSRRPIVASRCGGIPETVVDDCTGFLVEPNDLEALTDRVALLISDQALSRRMGAEGRCRVVRSFNVRRYVTWLALQYGFAQAARGVNAADTPG